MCTYNVVVYPLPSLSQFPRQPERERGVGESCTTALKSHPFLPPLTSSTTSATLLQLPSKRECTQYDETSAAPFARGHLHATKAIFTILYDTSSSTDYSLPLNTTGIYYILGTVSLVCQVFSLIGCFYCVEARSRVNMSCRLSSINSLNTCVSKKS